MAKRKKYKRTDNDLHNIHLVVYWPFKYRDHCLVQCKNNMLFLCNCDITNLHCVGYEYISGHFKQYFCNIVAIIFIAGWNRRVHRNPPIYPSNRPTVLLRPQRLLLYLYLFAFFVYFTTAYRLASIEDQLHQHLACFFTLLSLSLQLSTCMRDD